VVRSLRPGIYASEPTFYHAPSLIASTIYGQTTPMRVRTPTWCTQRVDGVDSADYL
jgi:hypothetical protein